MDSSDVVAAFDRELQRQLDRHKPALLAYLRDLTTVSMPAEVGSLVFWIEDNWGGDFPMYVHAFDARVREQLFLDVPWLGQLLPSTAPFPEEGTIDQDEWESAGVVTFDRLEQLLTKLFDECWQESGASALRLPAYVGTHESDLYYDLAAREWLDGLPQHRD